MARSPLPSPRLRLPPSAPRSPRWLAATAAAALLLAGCAGGPGGGGTAGRDGPGTRPSAELLAIPDARPRIESVRSGGPNKPYAVLGRSYQPLQGDPAYREQGLASWYGRAFHGKSTASGEPYDMYAMSAAHPTLPIPSYVRVRNPANGAEAILRVNDRGPFHDGRVIDLSYTAALKLGLLRGVAPVEVERITWQDIRTGAWQRGGTALASAAPSEMPSAAGPVAGTADAIAGQQARTRTQAQAWVQAQSAAQQPEPWTTLPSPTPAPQPVAAGGMPGAGASVPSMAWPDSLEGAVELPAQALAADAVAGVAMRPQDAPRIAPLAPGAPPLPEPTRPSAPIAVKDRASAPADSPVPVAAADGGFWVQLGAFGLREGAERLRARAEADASGARFAIVTEGGLHRVQAGPFDSRTLARGAAERLGGILRLSPVVVERR
jgi:rare lipoprotein A